ncbi:MAG: GspH/FimT family pseudopilin [Candidatus Hydrogenedentes bacterium]|nr:GspH/FimT family pseudopilin [Candidatus Hydrogenedentota bacterium]
MNPVLWIPAFAGMTGYPITARARAGFTPMTDCPVTGRARAGFTLMELIVVLAIISILSAAVVPVFRGTFESVESDHTLRDLVATIKYAQERAVTDCREYRLYLSPKTNEYWLKSLVWSRGKKNKKFTAVEDRQGDRMLLSKRIEIQRLTAKKDRKEKASYIAFYPSGACDHASITLARENGKHMKIELRGALGELKVETK